MKIFKNLLGIMMFVGTQVQGILDVFSYGEQYPVRYIQAQPQSWAIPTSYNQYSPEARAMANRAIQAIQPQSGVFDWGTWFGQYDFTFSPGPQDSQNSLYQSPTALNDFNAWIGLSQIFDNVYSTESQATTNVSNLSRCITRVGNNAGPCWARICHHGKSVCIDMNDPRYIFTQPGSLWNTWP